jgi:hypothetical protein
VNGTVAVLAHTLTVACWIAALAAFIAAVDELPYGNGSRFEIVGSLIVLPFALGSLSRFRNSFALGLLLIGGVLYARYPDRAFSSDAWREVTQCDGLTTAQCGSKLNECRRLAMVRDLAARHLRPAEATRGQLRSLLGMPDEWSEAFPSDDIYYLGYCGYLGVHNHLLEVTYTPDGTLERYGGKDYNW